ncbi:hypothetical protein GCM10009839_38850 [Catenulispora yoronensis]|uniref:Uncharacterized protein n=1 Tax=Catenulispora yoronensis TaxID=450799 RepID=A0ABP5FYS9_9ACTN
MTNFDLSVDVFRQYAAGVVAETDSVRALTLVQKIYQEGKFAQGKGDAAALQLLTDQLERCRREHKASGD